MMRLGLLGAVSAVAVLVAGGTAMAGFDDPMRFTLQPPDPECADCRTILAQGEIMLDTPRVLESFLAKLSPVGRVRVEFDSPGGYIAGAIDMGKIIRAWHLDTSVSRHYSPGDRARSRGSECYSACSYAFLGGIRRTVAREAAYGVHETYFEDPDDPAITLFEPLIGNLSNYLLESYIEEMGSSPKLLALASTIDSWDMHVLSEDELVHYAVITPQVEPGAWQVADGVATLRQGQPGGFAAGLAIGCAAEQPGTATVSYWREARGTAADQWAAYMNQFLTGNQAGERWMLGVGIDGTALARVGNGEGVAGFGGVAAANAGEIAVSVPVAAAELLAALGGREMWVFGRFPDTIIASGYGVEGWFPLDGAAEALRAVLADCG